ncbi:tetratricopeptide repeat protein [Comamonadaceae bacterium G21597-S1]|nr:tetratricopeptide repeat protein [Comamonadaceae bacterium G21597-S1]
MPFPLVALVLCATLASPSLQAADTGPVVSPPSARERIDLAREAIRKQDWRRALAELNRAARDEPRNADIHNLLGYSYRKQARADLPKAFEHYRRAIELDPRHKGAHEYIGEAYLMDRKPQEAEKHLAALQQICGNTTCEEYVDLARAIADYKLKN